MTEYKNIKRALEKALNTKANAVTVPNGWEAGTVLLTDKLSVYIFKRKDGTVYYYATIGEKPISWHNNIVDGPTVWVGENYSIMKKAVEEGTMNIIMDGICHLGHFAPECLEQALAF